MTHQVLDLLASFLQSATLLESSQLKSEHRMHLWIIYLVLSRCAAVSLFRQDGRRTSLKTLQPDWLDQTHFVPDQTRFTLPSKDDASLIRVREIQQKRKGYLYGPSLLGNTSYFPTGFLGDAMVKQHVDSWLRDAAWVNHAVEEEANAAVAAAKEVSSTTSSIERWFLRNLEGWPQEYQRLSDYL